MLELSAIGQKVRIDAGELVGCQANGHEYIHQKGSPGWRNSDTEMFPIIGPMNRADFRVETPRGNAIQDQHGLLRELAYELVSQTKTTATFKKSYKAGTFIKNSKYPERSKEQMLIWPYDFHFLKKFELKKDGLEITFTVSGEKDMPFMLGYHPAFRLHTNDPYVKAGHRAIALAEVLKVGSRALPVLDCDTLILEDKGRLTIKTEGFGNFMLWTEVPNMICIEPITFYPYAVEQQQLHTGFQFLGDKEKIFKICFGTNN